MKQSALLRRRWFTVAATVAAVAMIVVAAAAGVLRDRDSRGESGLVDMQGHPVRPEAVPTAGARARASAEATPDGAGRFVVRSVGLDVPLGSMKVADGAIDPPGFRSAYWVRNLGVPVSRGGHGTVFVVMHSLRKGGVGPGNYLIDVERGQAKVGPGAVIGVGGVEYKVTRVREINKDRIGGTAGVWADTPGRLVVITCQQRPDGEPSTENLVIEAART